MCERRPTFAEVVERRQWNGYLTPDHVPSTVTTQATSRRSSSPDARQASAALVEAVIAAGHNAVVAARDLSKVAELTNSHPDRVLPLALDVTDPMWVAVAVEKADSRFGRIDVVENNAGHGYRAAVRKSPSRSGGCADV